MPTARAADRRLDAPACRRATSLAPRCGRDRSAVPAGDAEPGVAPTGALPVTPMPMAALVTGAAQRIGRALALALAKENGRAYQSVARRMRRIVARCQVSVRRVLVCEENAMKLCRFDQDRLGVVIGHMVHDVTAAQDEIRRNARYDMKGDAVIAAHAEASEIKTIVSENRQFLQTLRDLPVNILTADEAQNLLVSLPD